MRPRTAITIVVLLTLAVSVLVFAVTHQGPFASPTLAEQSDPIRIATEAGQMAFDVTAFTVKAGSQVTLVFKNDDAMEHNIIFARQTGGEDVYMALGQKVLEMGAAAREAEYVPDSDLVLAYSRLLQPGQEDSITFTAPEEPGAYPYVCTIPGHPASMNGVMHVTEDGQPVEEDAPESGFETLDYRYFEGEWEVIPDFDSKEPVKHGRVPDDLITLELREQDDYFGFVFEGRLRVPESGEYTFLLRSDDGSRLYINDEQVIDHDGLHGAEEVKRGSIELEAGLHDLRVDYFEHTVAFELDLAWIGPDGEPQAPLTTDSGLGQMGSFIIHPQERAKVYRGPLPDLPPRSLAVGFPQNIHYAFDAEQMVIRYGWQGMFLDHGPMVGYGSQRGPNDAQPLGNRFMLGAVDRPLRIGDPDALPEVRFRGYQQDSNAPILTYKVDQTEITQRIEPLPDARQGFAYHFELEPTPSETIYFLVDNPQGFNLEASAGQWDDGVLSVPAEQAQDFTIKIEATGH